MIHTGTTEDSLSTRKKADRRIGAPAAPVWSEEADTDIALLNNRARTLTDVSEVEDRMFLKLRV